MALQNQLIPTLTADELKTICVFAGHYVLDALEKELARLDVDKLTKTQKACLLGSFQAAARIGAHEVAKVARRGGDISAAIFTKE